MPLNKLFNRPLRLGATRCTQIAPQIKERRERRRKEKMEKKRRWYFSQMGVPIVHKDIDGLIGELGEIEKNGLDGDTFELKIMDMTDEEYNKLKEFEG
jgi:hypothetical protein